MIIGISKLRKNVVRLPDILIVYVLSLPIRVFKLCRELTLLKQADITEYLMRQSKI